MTRAVYPSGKKAPLVDPYELFGLPTRGPEHGAVVCFRCQPCGVEWRGFSAASSRGYSPEQHVAMRRYYEHLAKCPRRGRRSD